MRKMELPPEPLGRHRDVHPPAIQQDAILHIDVVRPIDPGDRLPNLSVHAEDDNGAGGRCHLHGADDEAACRIRGVHPDCRIVRVVREAGRRGPRPRFSTAFDSGEGDGGGRLESSSGFGSGPWRHPDVTATESARQASSRSQSRRRPASAEWFCDHVALRHTRNGFFTCSTLTRSTRRRLH